ncbi:MAG TPA: hypothetical protein VNS32_00990 [Flavisolibacter sp.]|nr:hypothetical protein [Flavisolibacter sp.]
MMLVSASIAAFASLGDGGKRDAKNTGLSLSSKSFTLRSGYNYRGNLIFTKPVSNKFIMLNAEITYQKGNSTYIMPLKKKVFLDKIKFNPTQPKF